MRGRGLSVYKPDKTSDGYTLFTPLETKNAYLIDMQAISSTGGNSPTNPATTDTCWRMET